MAEKEGFERSKLPLIKGKIVSCAQLMRNRLFREMFNFQQSSISLVSVFLDYKGNQP